MLVYKAAYKWDGAVCVGEVLDFPGTVSCGQTLDDARRNLSKALVDMAETNLLRGEPLPLHDASRGDPEAELEEPIHLLVQAGSQLVVQAAVPSS